MNSELRSSPEADPRDVQAGPLGAPGAATKKVLCDRVRCMNCSMRAWVVRGADVCPECDRYGTLSWDQSDGRWDEACTQREVPRILLPAAGELVPDVTQAQVKEATREGARVVFLYSEGPGDEPGGRFHDLHGIWIEPAAPEEGRRHLSPTEDPHLYDELSDLFYRSLED